MYTLLLALNKHSIINKHQIASIIVMIPAILIGGYWFGLVGASIALLISRILTFPYIWLQTQKVLLWKKS